MSDSEKSVSVLGISKLFGSVRALAETDFKVSEGEVVSVMGPNGAGKSTFLSILSLVMRPTKGKVLFFGKEALPKDEWARQTVGMVSHDPMLYREMTGEENLRFFASLYGIDHKERISELAETLNLADFFSSKPVGVLSRGQLQRVSLARALLSSPKLLLLDEPASGLDRSSVKRIESILEEHKNKGGMAVVVTHEVELASRVADRAVIMKKGRIACDRTAPGEPDAWRALYTQTLEEN